MGLKFSTPVFFWVEDLTVYFFGSEKSACIFLGSNFCQANSSYAIQAKVPDPARSKRQKGSMYTVLKIAFLGYKSHAFFGSKISGLIFFWVHNIRSMYFFGCKILGFVGPPPVTFIPEYRSWGKTSSWFNMGPGPNISSVFVFIFFSCIFSSVMVTFVYLRGMP